MKRLVEQWIRAVDNGLDFHTATQTAVEGFRRLHINVPIQLTDTPEEVLEWLIHASGGQDEALLRERGLQVIDQVQREALGDPLEYMD